MPSQNSFEKRQQEFLATVIDNLKHARYQDAILQLEEAAVATLEDPYYLENPDIEPDLTQIERWLGMAYFLKAEAAHKISAEKAEPFLSPETVNNYQTAIKYLDKSEKAFDEAEKFIYFFALSRANFSLTRNRESSLESISILNELAIKQLELAIKKQNETIERRARDENLNFVHFTLGKYSFNGDVLYYNLGVYHKNLAAHCKSESSRNNNQQAKFYLEKALKHYEIAFEKQYSMNLPRNEKAAFHYDRAFINYELGNFDAAKDILILASHSYHEARVFKLLGEICLKQAYLKTEDTLAESLRYFVEANKLDNQPIPFNFIHWAINNEMWPENFEIPFKNVAPTQNALLETILLNTASDPKDAQIALVQMLMPGTFLGRVMESSSDRTVTLQLREKIIDELGKFETIDLPNLCKVYLANDKTLEDEIKNQNPKLWAKLWPEKFAQYKTEATELSKLRNQFRILCRENITLFLKISSLEKTIKFHEDLNLPCIGHKRLLAEACFLRAEAGREECKVTKKPLSNQAQKDYQVCVDLLQSPASSQRTDDRHAEMEFLRFYMLAQAYSAKSDYAQSDDEALELKKLAIRTLDNMFPTGILGKILDHKEIETYKYLALKGNCCEDLAAIYRKRNKPEETTEEKQALEKAIRVYGLAEAQAPFAERKSLGVREAVCTSLAGDHQNAKEKFDGLIARHSSEHDHTLYVERGSAYVRNGALYGAINDFIKVSNLKKSFTIPAEFFEIALQIPYPFNPYNKWIFDDLEKTKNLLISSIKKLTDQKLKQRMLFQALVPETFIGSVFNTKRNLFGEPTIKKSKNKQLILDELAKIIQTSTEEIVIEENIAKALEANEEFRSELHKRLFPHTSRSQAIIENAKRLLENGNYARAITYINGWTDEHVNNPHVQRVLGEAYFLKAYAEHQQTSVLTDVIKENYSKSIPLLQNALKSVKIGPMTFTAIDEDSKCVCHAMLRDAYFNTNSVDPIIHETRKERSVDATANLCPDGQEHIETSLHHAKLAIKYKKDKVNTKIGPYHISMATCYKGLAKTQERQAHAWVTTNQTVNARNAFYNASKSYADAIPLEKNSIKKSDLYYNQAQCNAEVAKINAGANRSNLWSIVTACTTGIKLSPLNNQLYVSRGHAYLQLGDSISAINDFTQATKIKKGSKIPQEFLQAVMKSTAWPQSALEKGQFDNIIKTKRRVRDAILSLSDPKLVQIALCQALVSKTFLGSLFNIRSRPLGASKTKAKIIARLEEMVKTSGQLYMDEATANLLKDDKKLRDEFKAMAPLAYNRWYQQCWNITATQHEINDLRVKAEKLYAAYAANPTAPDAGAILAELQKQQQNIINKHRAELASTFIEPEAKKDLGTLQIYLNRSILNPVTFEKYPARTEVVEGLSQAHLTAEGKEIPYKSVAVAAAKDLLVFENTKNALHDALLSIKQEGGQTTFTKYGFLNIRVTIGTEKEIREAFAAIEQMEKGKVDPLTTAIKVQKLLSSTPFLGKKTKVTKAFCTNSLHKLAEAVKNVELTHKKAALKEASKELPPSYMQAINAPRPRQTVTALQQPQVAAAPAAHIAAPKAVVIPVAQTPKTVATPIAAKVATVADKVTQPAETITAAAKPTFIVPAALEGCIHSLRNTTETMYQLIINQKNPSNLLPKINKIYQDELSLLEKTLEKLNAEREFLFQQIYSPEENARLVTLAIVIAATKRILENPDVISDAAKNAIVNLDMPEAKDILNYFERREAVMAIYNAHQELPVASASSSSENSSVSVVYDEVPAEVPAPVEVTIADSDSDNEEVPTYTVPVLEPLKIDGVPIKVEKTKDKEIAVEENLADRIAEFNNRNFNHLSLGFFANTAVDVTEAATPTVPPPPYKTKTPPSYVEVMAKRMQAQAQKLVQAQAAEAPVIEPVEVKLEVEKPEVQPEIKAVEPEPIKIEVVEQPEAKAEVKVETPQPAAQPQTPQLWSKAKLLAVAPKAPANLPGAPEVPTHEPSASSYQSDLWKKQLAKRNNGTNKVAVLAGPSK